MCLEIDVYFLLSLKLDSTFSTVVSVYRSLIFDDIAKSEFGLFHCIFWTIKWPLVCLSLFCLCQVIERIEDSIQGKDRGTDWGKNLQVSQVGEIDIVFFVFFFFLFSFMFFFYYICLVSSRCLFWVVRRWSNTINNIEFLCLCFMSVLNRICV